MFYLLPHPNNQKIWLFVGNTELVKVGGWIIQYSCKWPWLKFSFWPFLSITASNRFVFFVANAIFFNVVVDIIVFFVFIDQVTCRPNQDKNSNLEQQHLVNVMSIHSSHDLLHFSGIFSLYSFSRLSIMPLHLDSQSPFQNPPQAKIFLTQKRPSGR